MDHTNTGETGRWTYRVDIPPENAATGSYVNLYSTDSSGGDPTGNNDDCYPDILYHAEYDCSAAATADDCDYIFPQSSPEVDPDLPTLETEGTAPSILYPHDYEHNFIAPRQDDVCTSPIEIDGDGFNLMGNTYSSLQVSVLHRAEIKLDICIA